MELEVDRVLARPGISNFEKIQRFLSSIGHEEVTTSVFDSNNRGVDFFLLPVYYSPQLCGSAPDSPLQTVQNSYIADRYLILRQLGRATFSVTVECVDMRSEQNLHLCLKVHINPQSYLLDYKER